MAKEILDAEQLDSMWPTDATSEPRLCRPDDAYRRLAVGVTEPAHPREEA
jgi:hypothetical protein